jgi:hypothetical protein
MTTESSVGGERQVDAARTAPEVEVRLADGAASGFASIIQQFLVQQLAGSARLRKRAARLRGRLALSATDYGMAVTLEFGSRGVVIHDGIAPSPDGSIAGPYQALVELVQGRTNPLVEHLRGRLKVRVRLRSLFLPLRVSSLMKLRD